MADSYLSLSVRKSSSWSCFYVHRVWCVPFGRILGILLDRRPPSFYYYQKAIISCPYYYSIFRSFGLRVAVPHVSPGFRTWAFFISGWKCSIQEWDYPVSPLGGFYINPHLHHIQNILGKVSVTSWSWSCAMRLKSTQPGRIALAYLQYTRGIGSRRTVKLVQTACVESWGITLVLLLIPYARIHVYFKLLTAYITLNGYTAGFVAIKSIYYPFTKRPRNAFRQPTMTPPKKSIFSGCPSKLPSWSPRNNPSAMAIILTTPIIKKYLNFIFRKLQDDCI